MMVVMILAVMAGTIVQSVAGFAFAIVAMMVFPLIIGDVSSASAVAGIFALVNATANAYKYREHIQWRNIFIPLIAYGIFSTLALSTIGKVSNRGLMAFLGVVLVVLGIYFLFFQKNMRIKANRRNGFIAGSCGGVLGGLFSIAGPPMALYYTMLLGDEKYTYLACINTYFALSNVFVACLRIHYGILGLEEVQYLLMGVVGLILGRFIGGKLVRKIDGQKMKKLIYIVMICSGVYYMLPF